MYLAHQIAPDPRPVLLEVVSEIVTLIAHVERNLFIDLPRQPIPDRARISVLADRSVSSVPRGDLLPAAYVASQNGFEAAHLSHRQGDLSIRVSWERPDYLGPIAVRYFECIVILIDIPHLITPEINWVRIQDPRAVEELRMEYLQSQRFPASSRTPRQHSRVRVRNDPEFLLQIRNQFLRERVTIRSVVRRVHRIRVIVVRRRVLKCHRYRAREVVRHPCLSELVSTFARAHILSRFALRLKVDT